MTILMIGRRAYIIHFDTEDTGLPKPLIFQGWEIFSKLLKLNDAIVQLISFGGLSL